MLKEWLLAVLGHSGRNDEAVRKLEPWLRDANACIILRLVLENPGITIDGLDRRLQMGRAIVDGCVNGFIASGLVVPEKEGERTGYHIAGAAKAAVAEHLPLNYQCPGMMRE